MTDDMRLLLRILLEQELREAEPEMQRPERNGKQSGRMESIMPRLRAEEKRKEQKIP